MPSPSHVAYRAGMTAWFRTHGTEPDVAELLTFHQDALLVLWHLDLTPCLPILLTGYAPQPRGGDPWDPLVLLRCLLLALLVGQPSINRWVDELAASRVLRVLAGLLTSKRKRPGVGTFYDFFHRLHDGPQRRTCEHQTQPSLDERRRSKDPQHRKPIEPPPPKEKKQRGGRRRKNEPAPPVIDPAVTAKLVAELDAARTVSNPADFLARLGALLLNTGVLESARRGLLGDLDRIVAGGDGSPLRTGGSKHGKRLCDHPKRERCGCPKQFSDPDAQWGYDNQRKCFFYGHHFYEISVSSQGHDLPLAIRIDPGNVGDFTASLYTYERLYKNLAALPLAITTFVADAGHDAEPIYRYLLDRGATPIIPLKEKAPAKHPVRPTVTLSPRGIPTCEAHVELSPWGSSGPRSKVFVCPVKAHKLKACPLAPPDQPNWVCRPDAKLAPVVNLHVDDNPRLCPPVPRNHPNFQKLMDLRSGCERSNSAKKECFKLEAARHRRSSFWLIRLHLIALLQHAKAWVAHDDAADLVSFLLGQKPQPLAA